MFGFGILSCLVFLPLVGVAFILCLRGEDEATLNNARWAAFATTIIVFLLSLYAWAMFDPAQPGFQLVEERGWFGSGLVYKLGVDGISMPFVLLTAFLTPFCIAASWTSVTYRVKEYMIAFLALETLMLGVFCALDLVLFYLFFEGGLIPMFLIIGVWGGKRRVYAAFKFFLYTLVGSLLMLLAVMAMYGFAGTTDIVALLKAHFPASMQTWLFLAFFASLAVKMPMWPVHTWLPDAHVEAPTAGSVILAGILLKMGGYGFIRFSLPMFPDASAYFAPFVYALSIIAIVYTSLVALVQEDMKKLIAYSSVAHMGFVTMGLFTMTEQGVQGAMFQMISHGFVSGALFLCVGVVYDRMHTREIAAYGGLVARMPVYAVVFMVFTMANVGLPGTSGFIGEFLSLLGGFRVNSFIALFATTGVIFSAAYALTLYRKVMFGPLDKPALRAMLDLNWREKAIFAPLVALTIYYGVHPKPILDASKASIAQLIETYDTRLAAHDGQALAAAESGTARAPAVSADRPTY
ncbi:NADH-quinone oxidoreductase subunit M [Methylocella sp.]|uniref:NADH-quinone oxidoreductase subunit M n=1 Tax=Methylocella sp. TaxID=1978226 RepID=UPI0037835520